MGQGIFITFEGGEGSGKTTQINKLAEKLTAQKIRVVTTREPGGTDEAEKIRDLIVQRGGGEWTPLAETLLLCAARAMHVEKVILPFLGEEKIVICDRFTDSTLAYQGYGRGLDKEAILKLQDITIGDLKPDLTFILDIDPKTGLARSGRRMAAETLQVDQTEDRFENMELEFHERLRAGFLEIAKKEPERCHVIDASKDAEKIAEKIASIVMKRLGK